MKKSMKKYLIMLLVVTIVALTATVIVSAASTSSVTPYCANPGCNNNTDYYIDENDPNTYVEAGCETIGYTRIKCSNCGQFMNGYINVVPANGHSWVKTYVLSENGKYYEHHEICSVCDNTTMPEPDVKYYKVTFYNPFATNGKDHYADEYPYINLVDAERYGDDAYVTKELAVEYVAEGGLAEYEGQCVRETDRIFSNYTLVGWASKTKVGLNSNGTINKDIIDTRVVSRINSETNSYVYPERHYYVFGNKSENQAPIYIVDENVKDARYFSVPVAGEEEKADYDVYAVFAGNRETHTVTFKNYAGAVEKTVQVIHGFGATYGLKDPEHVPDYQVYYTFDGYWTWFDGTEEHQIDLNNIYDSITVSPHFTMHSNTYIFRYFEKATITCENCGYENPYNAFRLQDGALVCPKCTKKVVDNRVPYIDSQGNPLEDEVAIAGPQKNDYVPTNGRNVDVKSRFDRSYIYTYTGLWQISNRIDSKKVNIYDVTLPSDVLSYQEIGGYIALTPHYTQTLRTYSLPIKIYYPDDNNNHPEEIDLQIVNSEGATRRITLTADDIVNKKAVDSGREAEEYHVVVPGMKYSDSYRITATSRTYQGVADRIIFLDGKADVMDDDKFSDVEITLEHLKQKDCNCICHTVFKPIWVAALNLLNTLFRVEYVCCDDMFANIGDKLNYGK